jgi:hypothetical protein
MNPITRGMNNFCEGLVNSSHANYISSSQSTYISPPPPEHKPVENIRSYTQPSEMKLPLFSPSLVSYQHSYLPKY